jgi:hypothetical protein
MHLSWLNSTVNFYLTVYLLLFLVNGLLFSFGAAFAPFFDYQPFALEFILTDRPLELDSILHPTSILET